MVTESAVIEDHIMFTGEPPPIGYNCLKTRKRIAKAEDPMSHRIIEKRRRDRMNNCLADLSRLIPADYLKKGRGRIEKTEIIEMAIKHMRYLQNALASVRHSTSENHIEENRNGKQPKRETIVAEHYRLGYLECLSEAMHFLVEVQGYFAGDTLCVQMMNHLHKHCDKILKGDAINFPRKHNGETASNSSASTTNGTYNTSNNNSPPLGMSNSTGCNSDDQINNNSFERNPNDSYDRENYNQQTNQEQEYNYPVQHHQASTPPPTHQFTNQTRRFTDDVPQYLGKDLSCRNYSNSSGFISSTTLERNPSFDEDIKDDVDNESQLREMLTSPTSSNLPVNSIRSKASETKTLSPTLLPSSGCESSSNGFFHSHSENFPQTPQSRVDSETYDSEHHHAMYKFKNNIKQRFTKETDEHQTKKQKTTDSTFRFSSKTPKSIYSEGNFDLSNRLGFGHKKKEMKVPADTTGVAVFALHASKSFYVPLTLQQTVLSQFLSILGLSDTCEDVKPVLHPVTISVNFQPQLHVKEEQKQWRNSRFCQDTPSPTN